MESRTCWCPVCDMFFEGGADTERWIRDENLFIPAHQGCWLQLAAHLVYGSYSVEHTIPVRQYSGPYKDTPCCTKSEHWSASWSEELGDSVGGSITCWCGERWWDGTSCKIERFAEHLWVSNVGDPGGLDQHYRQAVATKLLGAM